VVTLILTVLGAMFMPWSVVLLAAAGPLGLLILASCLRAGFNWARIALIVVQIVCIAGALPSLARWLPPAFFPLLNGLGGPITLRLWALALSPLGQLPQLLGQVWPGAGLSEIYQFVPLLTLLLSIVFLSILTRRTTRDHCRAAHRVIDTKGSSDE
jgi:hypothetical protein